MSARPILFLSFIVCGCTTVAVTQLNRTYGPEIPRERMVSHDSEAGIDWHQKIKPVIEKRCVVCHGCYDAPCQLDLSSPEGIDRGASSARVYNGARLSEAAPTRLFQDAPDTRGWRSAGFHPVLNERDQTPEANLTAGVMAQMLALKGSNPLPDQPLLPASFDLALNRKQQCPGAGGMTRYSRQKPLWGMPYALPRLADDDYATLQSWLAGGALMAGKPPLTPPLQMQVDRWEQFLNGESTKAQLMSRYIYEHWFLAHLYFDQVPEKEFFRIVRSRTPPGEPIDIIATRRPYDDPEVQRVFYRLWREQGTILDKTHMPYALDDDRMEKFSAWFLDPAFDVPALPAYDPATAANPFIAYESIPVGVRWRFLLEEAQFTIMNFIKGPVCRGQIALNVINDHFWVFFVSPAIEDTLDSGHFLATQQQHLRIPVEEGSNAAPFKTWRRYSNVYERYLKAKTDEMERLLRNGEHLTLDVVWDGEGVNPNAALTVFRHRDSASVVQGLVGSSPKTAWLIDYALLERIHYLLVAGFDVFGNLGHQLNTRLYMDFLRMEGEFNFLALLPNRTRKELRDHWYRGTSKNQRSYIFGSRSPLHEPSSIPYATDHPKEELYGMLHRRLKSVLNNEYAIEHPQVPKEHRWQLQRLARVRGISASLLPQTASLAVRDAEDSYWFYTVIHNNAHSNITSLFSEDSNRLPEEDDVTVARGFVGSYPSAFWRVDEDRLSVLVDTILQMEDEEAYGRMMNRYGVRRTSSEFWDHGDLIHAGYRALAPVTGGLLDFNRLENR